MRQHVAAYESCVACGGLLDVVSRILRPTSGRICMSRTAYAAAGVSLQPPLATLRPNTSHTLAAPSTLSL